MFDLSLVLSKKTEKKLKKILAHCSCVASVMKAVETAAKHSVLLLTPSR